MIEYEAVVTDNDIQIKNSFAFRKNEFPIILNDIEEQHPGNPVLENRSRFSLEMEWACHNALYGMNIQRERTKDVDLEYPQKWYMTAAYCVGGMLVWMFVE